MEELECHEGQHIHDANEVCVEYLRRNGYDIHDDECCICYFGRRLKLEQDSDIGKLD